MSANIKKTVVVLVAAGLAGCEAVAGIQDLTYEPPGDDSGIGGDGAPDVRDGSNDASNRGDTTGGDAASDANEASAPLEGGGDGGAAPPDAPSPVDSGGDAAVGDARVDGTPDGGQTPDTGAGGNDAGGGMTTVPEAGPSIIPGADGGPIRGVDGGVLQGDLIDNMDLEIAPGNILSNGARRGTWFTYSDGTDGGVLPLPTAGPTTIIDTITSFSGVAANKAAHVTGNGLAAYAGVGFNANALATAMTYDASAYQGITFWVRTGTGTTSLSFNIPDLNSVTGGGCTVCGANFAFRLVTVTTTWQQVVVYFNQLAQPSFGMPRQAALDVAAIYGAQFQMSAGAAFDVWVDDVYFIVK